MIFFGSLMCLQDFVSCWLIVWADGVNQYDWCLAGGRGCWLKGPHPIPSVSWIIHHCTPIRLPHLCQGAMTIVLLLQMMGTLAEGWEGLGFIYVRGQWIGIIFSIFFTVFVLLLIFLSWLVHDSFSVCFFVPFLLSLFLVPLIRHY